MVVLVVQIGAVMMRVYDSFGQSDQMLDISNSY
jgi:hypothetical protein